MKRIMSTIGVLFCVLTGDNKHTFNHIYETSWNSPRIVYTVVKYDFDLDGVFEYNEVYKKVIGVEHSKTPNYPYAYFIDVDKNGHIEPWEVLIDDYEDGLNGNETRIDEPDKHVRKYNI